MHGAITRYLLKVRKVQFTKHDEFYAGTSTDSELDDTLDWGGGGIKTYSRLSTTHGYITDCKLDSVVYAGVGVVI